MKIILAAKDDTRDVDLMTMFRAAKQVRDLAMDGTAKPGTPVGISFVDQTNGRREIVGVYVNKASVTAYPPTRDLSSPPQNSPAGGSSAGENL